MPVQVYIIKSVKIKKFNIKFPGTFRIIAEMG